MTSNQLTQVPTILHNLCYKYDNIITEQDDTLARSIAYTLTS